MGNSKCLLSLISHWGVTLATNLIMQQTPGQDAGQCHNAIECGHEHCTGAHHQTPWCYKNVPKPSVCTLAFIVIYGEKGALTKQHVYLLL